MNHQIVITKTSTHTHTHIFHYKIYTKVSVVISIQIGRRESWSKSAKQLDVASLTVRVVAVFLEGSLVEQLQTEGTREVFRVPLAAHGSDTLACNTTRVDM